MSEISNTEHSALGVAPPKRTLWWRWLISILLALGGSIVFLLSTFLVSIEVGSGFGGPFDSTPHPLYVFSLVCLVIISIALPLGITWRLFRQWRVIAVIFVLMVATMALRTATLL